MPRRKLTPDASGGALRRDCGFSESQGKLPVADISLTPDQGGGESAIVEAFCTTVPKLSTNPAGAEAIAVGMIALPIYRDSRVDEVVAIHF